MAKVKFRKITQSDYTALSEKDGDTLYFVSQPSTLTGEEERSASVSSYKLYLGDVPVTEGT